jgi:PAS domain-containing protein
MNPSAGEEPMPEKDLPSFEPSEDPESAPDRLQGDGLATQTIDLTSLFDPEVDSSGTFDLGSVGSTSFGRLLDSLPVPAILIAPSNRVVFSNQGCTRLTADYQDLSGVSFLDLVPRPSDRERAQVLANKTLSLLDRVFRTRKPLSAEAILEIHRRRIWTRLHLRAVKISSSRYVLVLIEDVTEEKKQLALNKRRDKESHELQRDLETLVDVANSELAVTKTRLTREIANHMKTQELLKIEKQKNDVLAQHFELATAVVSPAGKFHFIDNRFRELCEYELQDIPDFPNLIPGCLHYNDHDGEPQKGEWSCTAGAIDEESAVVVCGIVCRSGVKREVGVTTRRLIDGNYFVVCKTDPDLLRRQPIDGAPAAPT